MRSTASRCPSTETAGRSGTGSSSKTTARASNSCCTRASRARSTTSAAATRHENIDVAGWIIELAGADRSLLRSVPDRPGHDRRYSLDTSKLRSLGWAPKQRFEDGLRETVEWYRDNRAWWEPIKSGEYREYYERQYAGRLADSTAV